MTSAEVWRQREARAEREGAAAFLSGDTCPYKSAILMRYWQMGYNKAKEGNQREEGNA